MGIVMAEYMDIYGGIYGKIGRRFRWRDERSVGQDIWRGRR